VSNAKVSRHEARCLPSPRRSPRQESCAQPGPADPLTCLTLSALLWPIARARMRHLGIGPEAFDDGEAAMIAGVLLSEREFTQRQRAILWRDDGRTVPWYRAVELATLDPNWAVRIVNLFAAERARAWWPRWMAWIGQGVQDGQSLEWAVGELDELLAATRPVLRGASA